MQQSFNTTVELENVGTLEITGTTTCNKPSDTDSYEYQIETIELVEEEGRKDVYVFIQALFGEAHKCRLIDVACEVAMIAEWGSVEMDITTDYRQVA